MLKKVIIIFISFFFAMNTFSQKVLSDIDVVYLNAPSEDEKPIHNFLFPLMDQYLKFITHEYNKAAVKAHLNKKQNQKVFISTIYRSRVTQRENLFNYIIYTKGFRNFFSLYDRYNEQFAVQLLHIVMPIYVTNKSSKRILALSNLELERNLNTFYKLYNGVPTSTRLIKYFYLTKGTSYISSREALESIGKDALNIFKISDDFIQKAIDQLQKTILRKTRVSSDTAKIAAERTFYTIVAKSTFTYLTPKLKKDGKDLFSNEQIGQQLTQWFKTAPAYSQHSISELTDDELSQIKDVTDKGKTYTFAVDLGMQTNKGLDGSQIWNYNNSSNTLKYLKKVILSNPEFKTGDYLLTIIPAKLQMGHEELAVHISFSIKRVKDTDKISQEIDKATDDLKNNADTEQTPDKKSEDPQDHQEKPQNQKNTLQLEKEDENLSLPKQNQNRKNFETPNKDSNTPSENVPKLNYKDYNTILDKRKDKTHKQFENPKKTQELPY
jgi:hypothetical protein